MTAECWLARTVLGYSVLPLLFPLAAGFALPRSRLLRHSLLAIEPLTGMMRSSLVLAAVDLDISFRPVIPLHGESIRN
jgi:hypothetical protein